AHPSHTPFPYTTLFRSNSQYQVRACCISGVKSTDMSIRRKMTSSGIWLQHIKKPSVHSTMQDADISSLMILPGHISAPMNRKSRSEEHTSELQSRFDLV